MARSLRNDPKKPKFNLNLIITRTIIGVSFVTVICVIVAHFLSDENPSKLVKLVIDGPHCQVPEFHFTSLKELKIKRTKLSPCKSRRLLTSVTSTNKVEDSMFIQFKPEFLGDYGVSSAACCFRIIQRKGDSDVELSEVCQEFESTHQLNKSVEHIYTECKSNGEVVYSIVHAIITQKEKFQKRQRSTKINKAKAYKVLLLGFDNMSGMNFKRGMPLTSNLLKNKKEWFEMKGYTRLGNDTFSNLFAVLTGQSANEKIGKCDPRSNNFLDGCNFIWNEYQKAGYVTAFAEDQKDINTFNLHHKGFQKQPTDHYFRPFVLAAEKNLEIRKKDDLAFCLGSSLYVDHIFIYAMKMIQIHDADPYFGVFFVNSLNDKQLSSSVIMDKRISESFVTTLENTDMSDTILIYFSDTGTRFEESLAGFYEERFPLLSIQLPMKFQKAHPELVRNLRENANRLTTPYDLHITLRHIINLSVSKEVPLKAPGCRHCRSLFNEIPITRTCYDVNIPHDSCPCSLESISDSKLVVKYAALHAVDALNRKFKSLKAANGEACSILKLVNITSAKHQLTSPWNLNYIIEFEVTPSKAHFEALMERTLPSIATHPPQFNLLQEIVHINKEREPMVCVPDSQVRNKTSPSSNKTLVKRSEFHEAHFEV